MKQLKVDYTLCDKNFVIKKTGHISYSLPHFIHALFQYNFINFVNINSFWDTLDKYLNNAAAYNIFYAFAYNYPMALNSKCRRDLMTLLHSFGYYIFNNITSACPIFIKNKRTYLIDSKSNGEVMSFHFSIPKKKFNSMQYNKLYMSTLEANSLTGILYGKDTFKVKVVDVTSKNNIDNNIIEIYKNNIQLILDDLKKHDKIYEIKHKLFVYRISFSFNRSGKIINEENRCSFGDILISTEEEIKVSEYNYYTDNYNLALALRSASLIKLSDNKFYALKKGNLKIFGDDELYELKKMKFVVPNYNEYSQLQKDRRKQYRKIKNTLGLTILTTTVCNARCEYCYEFGIDKKTMPKSIQQKIIQLILKSGKKDVHISWFGGEPLMNASAITYISDALTKEGINYTSSMVSNGYLLNLYEHKLNNWRLKNVQITLDGISEQYNRIKNYVYNTANPFEIVIRNIELLLRNNIRSTIRLNFNRTNYEHILECIDYIHNLFGNNKLLHVYANHIFGEPSTYHLDDGTNLYFVVFKKLIDCGYINNLYNLGFAVKNFYCFIHNNNHIVINANGDYYICEHAVTDKNSGCIGNINNDKILNKSNYKYWTSLNYPYKKCKRCKFLFVCQGGCRSSIVNNYSDSTCIPYLDAVDDIIQYYYLNKKGDGYDGNN